MKIRVIKKRSGAVRWQLDLGVVAGRRVQRSFRSLAAAEKAMAAEMRVRKVSGQGLAGLSPAEVAEVVLARELLSVRPGVSLSQVVREWLAAQPVAGAASLPMEEALAAFLTAKELVGRSAGYLSNLKVTLGALVRHLGERSPVTRVTREVIEGWLLANAWAGRTRNGYLSNVRGWFDWMMRRGWVTTNPAAVVERVSVAEGEIEALTVAQAERLLRGALDAGDGVMMTWLVVGLFAGLRAAELERLRWEQIDLASGVVVVLGRSAKTRQRRPVELSAGALEWLRAGWRGAQMPTVGRVIGRNWQARWRVFRARCGFAVGVDGGGLTPAELAVVRAAARDGERWPKNALRHTYASMHYAFYQNETLLQAQMGHTSAAMLHRHYRAVVTRAEAARFWALRPEVSA